MLSINCGVPQGSILGPLLFIIYTNDINDIINVSKFANAIMFADDTNLFFSDSDLNNLINVANCELDIISLWFKLNKLSLNIKKKQISYYSKPQTALNLTISTLKLIIL